MRAEESPTTERSGAGDSLGELFWRVSREVRHASRERLEPWNLTPGQARALTSLMRSGAVRLSTLSDHLRIAPRSATEVVDALEARGFVYRRADPDDRRATLVDVTAAGRDAGTAIGRARTAQADDYFTRLNHADRDTLAAVLHRLLDD